MLASVAKAREKRDEVLLRKKHEGRSLSHSKKNEIVVSTQNEQ
jgi:hypothetical protein